MADENGISLPKSTMTRAVKEKLPEDMRIAADATEIILKCCEEFVHMVATTSNELSEKEKKSTISPEHILKSLEELGFTPYLDELKAALDEWKTGKKEERKAEKEKKANRADAGMSPEQLLALQQQLFQQARERTLTSVPQPAIENQSHATDDNENRAVDHVASGQEEQLRVVSIPELNDDDNYDDI